MLRRINRAERHLLLNPLLAVLLLCWLYSSAAGAVTVKILYGQGFQGPDQSLPRAPVVPGNTGTTVREQRRIAVEYAADFISKRLRSTVPIRIAVDFAPALCQPNGAVVGSATTTRLVSNFDHAPVANTLYPLALANALAGKRLLPGMHDIDAQFNAALDRQDSCLGGKDWYYGLDGAKPDGNLNFVSTFLHEFVHGLGFQSFVILDPASSYGSVGQFLADADGNRRPDIYSRHILDLNPQGLAGQRLWTEMTASQRAQSITNAPYVVWDGLSTNSAASAALTQGTLQGRVEIHAPSPVEVGSSISHLSANLAPAQLMAPAVTEHPILTLGIAACMLQDIGWTLTAYTTGCSGSGGSSSGGSSSGGSSSGGSSSGGSSSGGSSSGGSSSGGSSSGGSSSGGSSSGGSSSGGGCTLTGNAPFDPQLLGLLLVAFLGLRYRRKRTSATRR